ncbi:MAG: Nif3-like dinuclear metal center hexameric protein [Erysipelotrichaceae bacterium]|jgi:dinuclear metal center YbgI/SA1388 family protein|nr:Nif3-like dinuclear metal center hexameric protein [Erysipelotrichaceae bacterium]
MLAKELIKQIEQRYPFRIAKVHHDPSGLAMGDLKKPIKHVLVCLDLDEFVINDSKLQDIDMIITHHPYLYGKLKKVLKQDALKAKTYAYLKEKGFVVYGLHLPFDIAINGMNDALATKLGLIKIHQISGVPFARGGFLASPLSLQEFVLYTKQHFNLSSLGVVAGDKDRMINKVAIIGGGGSSAWKDVLVHHDYDCYLSGDVRHYERRDILRYHVNYLDLPHEIENVFVDKMAEVLGEIDPKLQVAKIIHEVPMEIK